jgi:hypothetical protein
VQANRESEPALTDAENETLVAILASTNVVWGPLRNEAYRPCQWLAQKTYREAGVSFRGGGTALERKTRQFILERLEAKRLVILSARQSGAATLVRLTTAGFTQARRLAELPDIEESFAFLRTVSDTWQDLRPRWAYRGIGGRYVPQSALVEVLTPLGPESIEALALPALERGWLSSASTCNGDVAYFIKPSGEEALATGPPNGAHKSKARKGR